MKLLQLCRRLNGSFARKFETGRNIVVYLSIFCKEMKEKLFFKNYL